MNWNNAGACSVATMQFRKALDDFSLAKRTAEAAGKMRPLIFTLNNIASLYLHMGEPAEAVRIAREALNGPAGHADRVMRAKLLCQLAIALADLGRSVESGRVFRQAINDLLAQKDFDGAVLACGAYGTASLRAGHSDQAESALNEGLCLLKARHLTASPSILGGLANVKARRGDSPGAETLYRAALAGSPGLNPQWMIYADRGRFRLANGDIHGALADFRESSRIALRMRADVVPVDQDRIALETGLSLVMEGLVDAGNRVARESGDRTILPGDRTILPGDPAILQETFDAAERDRLWSLQALVPSAGDWRTRLPERYWNILAQYQSLERSDATGEVDSQTSALRMELQQIEARAAGSVEESSRPAESPLDHVRRTLDEQSVLLSFHVTGTSSWVWAVDRQSVNAFPLPPIKKIQAEATLFSEAIRAGASTAELGYRIYQDLFGAVPQRYLRHKRWLLELDGPLHDLPFGALVVENRRPGPVYLIERAALQVIPGALLLQPGVIPAEGEFLGIGDPIYNAADPRFHGKRAPSGSALPRLPNTGGELRACAHAWNSAAPRLLVGADARNAPVQAALATDPAIVHFSTHIVTGPGEFRSGVIALSLDPAGAMGLLGPKEIVARRVTASIVVMDGCHSSQGDALPSAGLMGLTRAWIGAGAQAVLATAWDVPDDAAQSLMTNFYTSLRAARLRGAAFALRDAQLAVLHGGRGQQPVVRWAGYFLLSRME
jgi:CHAT domain-containing protein